MRQAHPTAQAAAGELASGDWRGRYLAFYNHQRPHQGIDGACPADRFYGVAGDVEAAVKQGCAENSLRLALGQETRAPLYLLGKLGGTDVRVTRKGDDIEVRLGDEVRELIRLALEADPEDGFLRWATATEPNCRLVVPYSCMCREANMLCSCAAAMRPKAGPHIPTSAGET